MKIGILSGLYEPIVIGGAEMVAAQSAGELVAQGHEVFVITSRLFTGLDSLKTSEQTDPKNGFRIYRFFPLNIAHYTKMLSRPFWFRALWHMLDMANIHTFFAVRKILRDERPDVLHTHGVKGLGYTVWTAARSCNVPIVHRIHDIQLVEPTGLLMAGDERRVNNAFHRLYIAVCKWFVKSPEIVESPSQWAWDMHRAQGYFKNSQSEIVSNPVPALPAVKHKKPESDVPRFLYVGQIEQHKGIEFLVKTLVAKIQMPFSMQIVGDGSQLERIRHLVADDNRFVVRGRLEGEELAIAFATATLLIVPSLCHENAPTVISIANSLGLPVIASKVGGIPEMVPVENLFTASDAQSLVDLIESKLKSIIDQTKEKC